MTTLDVLTSLAPIHQGRIEKMEDGFIWVSCAEHESWLPCYVLQNGNVLPQFEKMDHVLFVLQADAACGYILGKIATYHPENAMPPQYETPETEHEMIEIKTDQRRNIRLNGKRIHVQASEKIVLECGESALEMDHRGKVTLKGVDVNSRARRNNKIKGGNIALN